MTSDQLKPCRFFDVFLCSNDEECERQRHRSIRRRFRKLFAAPRVIGSGTLKGTTNLDFLLVAVQSPSMFAKA